MEKSPLLLASVTSKSGVLSAGCQVSCPEQMLLDRDHWVDLQTRSSWKSRPKLRLEKGVMEAMEERRFPRVSVGETKSQKQVPCPRSCREQRLNLDSPMFSPWVPQSSFLLLSPTNGHPGLLVNLPHPGLADGHSLSIQTRVLIGSCPQGAEHESGVEPEQ